MVQCSRYRLPDYYLMATSKDKPTKKRSAQTRKRTNASSRKDSTPLARWGVVCARGRRAYKTMSPTSGMAS